MKELGVEATVVKITDIGEIAMNGILSTPGLMVNGKIKHSGKPLPSLEKVKELIKGEAVSEEFGVRSDGVRRTHERTYVTYI